MTAKERVMSVLEGRTPDRVPLCFWHHFGPLPPQETVRRHVAWYCESGEDMLKMMCDEFFVYPLGDARTTEDFLALRPQGPDSYTVCGQAERAARINETLRGEAVSFYNAFSPYATLKHAIGQDKALHLIRTHETAAMHVLDVICEDTVSMIEKVLGQSGTAGMMLCLQGADRGLFTEEEYRRVIRPTEERVVEAANALSDTNLLHLCGWDNIPACLERWKDYPSRIVNWDVHVEGISLKEGKSFFGGRVVLGGFNNRTGTLLHTGSRAEIKAYARQLIDEAGPDGLIIGADCSVPQDIDPARIRWVAEACEEAALQQGL